MTVKPPGSPPPHTVPRDGGDNVDDVSRMSFGDHLDELRRCVIRALLGVGLAAVVCLVFGKHILAFVCVPLWRVQHANGLPAQLQVLSPTAAFTAYLKVALLSGLILAMPWLMYQFWLFIAAGLYTHERRFAKLFVPTSTALFLIGVCFVYYIVLPVVMQFFVSFNKGFAVGDLAPSALQRLLLASESETPPVVETPDLFSVPLLQTDPETPRDGQTWVNAPTRRLMYQTPTGVWSMAFDVGPTNSPMQSQFAIDRYIPFVLMLALGFGIAFETPIVVFFLARTGIVTTGAMARARRYVVLGCVVLGSVLTPPDVISQLLLAGPMYLLFELGLLVARRTERRTASNAG